MNGVGLVVSIRWWWCTTLSSIFFFFKFLLSSHLSPYFSSQYYFGIEEGCKWATSGSGGWWHKVVEALSILLLTSLLVSCFWSLLTILIYLFVWSIVRNKGDKVKLGSLNIFGSHIQNYKTKSLFDVSCTYGPLTTPNPTKTLSLGF